MIIDTINTLEDLAIELTHYGLSYKIDGYYISIITPNREMKPFTSDIQSVIIRMYEYLSETYTDVKIKGEFTIKRPTMVNTVRYGDYLNISYLYDEPILLYKGCRLIDLEKMVISY